MVRSRRTWQEAFRYGLAPELPLAGLEALADALQSDDPELIQHSITRPAGIGLCGPVEGACVVGFCVWKGLGLTTAHDVEARFMEAVARADRRLGEPAGTTAFFRWADTATRCELRRRLLPLVLAAVQARCNGRYQRA